MIDLHCDTIMMLIDEPDKGDLGQNPWKIDIAKLKKGGYHLQDFALCRARSGKRSLCPL